MSKLTSVAFGAFAPVLRTRRRSAPNAQSSIRTVDFQPGTHFSYQPQSASCPQLARNIACNANARRVMKVTRQIEREIGDMLVKDKVLREVTLIDSNSQYGGNVMCTCSGVKLSNDLQVAKVYILIMAESENIKDKMMSRLQGLSGYVRRKLAQRVRLRLAPEVRFLYDTAEERGEEVLAILKKLALEEEEEEKRKAGQSTGEAAEAEGFWDEDGEEEDEEEEDEDENNPFLEGVGDPRYDPFYGQPPPTAFVMPDMLPIIDPKIDELEAQERQAKWQEQNDRKRRARAKGRKPRRK